MLRGSSVLNRPVLTHDTGEQIDRIEDLVFHHLYSQIIAFIVSKRRSPERVCVLPWSGVQSVTPQSIIAHSRSMVVEADQLFEIKQALSRERITQGMRIMTADDRYLGRVIDLCFHERTGVIEGYEVIGGIFADSRTRRSFVPAPQFVTISRDTVLVPPATATMMQEQTSMVRNVVRIEGMGLRHSGPVVTAPVNWRVEQTRGRRVLQDIVSDDDYLVAVTGQIVTDRVIKRAQDARKTTDLVNAVRLDDVVSSYHSLER